MTRKRESAYNIAEAKKRLSDLVGRVAYGGETVLLLRRGRPMAKLVPIVKDTGMHSLADVKGWLEDQDPFFEAMDRIVSERRQRMPRVLGRASVRKKRRSTR